MARLSTSSTAGGGLQVRDLTVRFDSTVAVDDVDLEVPAGSVVAVLGPSGCGKSTLLRTVAGLEFPASGSVLYDGHDLAGVPTHKRGFALMFQDGQLFDHLDVAANIAYPLRLRHRTRDVQRERVAELLALVGLEGYAERSPATLSGGERQRVALARALAVDPRLLLLDEPLSSLDRGLRERLATELHDILRAAGATAMLVTHDQEEAFAVADRMAVMRDGRIVQSGTLDEVWSGPADAWTAQFLGYATVLTGAAARRLRDLAAPKPAGRPLPCAAPRCVSTRPARSPPRCRKRGSPPTRSGCSSTWTAPVRCLRLRTPGATYAWGLGACVHRHNEDRPGPRGTCGYSTLDWPVVKRRAYAPMVTIALVMGTLAIITGQALGYPLRDPDGFLGPAWVRLPLLCIGAFVADIVPRTLWRSRGKVSQFKTEARLLIREHWTRERIQLVVLGLICFYATYVSYRNLKNFLPFVRGGKTRAVTTSCTSSTSGCSSATTRQCSCTTCSAPPSPRTCCPGST